MSKYQYFFAWKGEAYRFSDDNKDRIMGQIRKKMLEVGAGVPDDRLLEKAIDRQTPLLKSKKSVSLAEAVSGAKALIKNVLGIAVSNEEIYRRSEICSNPNKTGQPCPNLSKIGGCGTCGLAGKISKYVNDIRVQKKISHPMPVATKGQFCGVCDCSLDLMLPTKISDFKNEAPEQNSSRPDFCWLKTTSPNYSNE